MIFLGRLLQISALILLPVAILMELTDILGRPFGVSDMLVMLVFGTCAFGIGRILEGYGRRPAP